MNPSRKNLPAGLLRYFPALLLSAALFLFLPAAASAAAKPVRIDSCRLISANKVRVTATVSDRNAISGDSCYLFALSLSDSNKKPLAAPLKAKTIQKKIRFSVPLRAGKAESLLYSRFVLAQKNPDGTFTAVSNVQYLTNPRKAANYRYSFPTAASKKGLQVSAEMLEDAQELNVSHSVLNIVFTDLIASAAESNDSASIPYTYHGTTYRFRRAAVSSYDRQLTALKQTGATVSAVLLLGWRDDLKYLIYPSGREPGHSFYAWNTSNAKAREQLQATISFLASRYCTTAAVNGRIANWIVGNEVNNYGTWNYAGSKTLKQYAQIYAKAFRLTYNTVASIYSNARVYISLDHIWNMDTVAGTFAARKMLDAFASALAGQGRIPWNIAFHAYNVPLTEPKFWLDTSGQTAQALTTPAINMTNIGVLTSYVRQTYEPDTRIILSEQGYTSMQNGVNVEKEQSAAIAYSYYLTEADDMIDSFILQRQVDHQAEIAQGLSLGLWTTDSTSASPEWAGQKKDSWNVFKYMDTNRSQKVTSESLSVIGAASWSDLIQGFSPSLYNKTSVATAKLRKTPGYQGRASLPSGWQMYGAAARQSAQGQTLTVLHDGSRNRSSLWGFVQLFRGGISFTSAPVFSTTIQVNGSTDKKITVKIRFYSGSNLLESERAIRAGLPVPLSVSLEKWKFKNKVTQIQILTAPVSGAWTNDASLTMTLPVRGK